MPVTVAPTIEHHGLFVFLPKAAFCLKIYSWNLSDILPVSPEWALFILESKSQKPQGINKKKKTTDLYFR